MRKVVLWLIAVLVLPGFVVAGPCGDADGNLETRAEDAVYLHHYFTFIGSPAPIGNADVDGRAGLSFGDDYRLLMYFFDSLNIDCVPSATYNLTPSLIDTFYLPRMLNIPDRVTYVVMNIRLAVGADAQGICLPLLAFDSVGGEHFDLHEVRGLDSSNIFRLIPVPEGSVPNAGADTVVLTFAGHQPMTGSSEYFQFIYRRTVPGVCDLQPIPFSIDSLHRPVILRGDDLFIPQIVYIDSIIPEPVMSIQPDSLSMAAVSGKRSSGTYAVEYSTLNGAATFVLESSEPWIRTRDFWGVTPGRVEFLADATSLQPGTYSGSITVTALEPTVIITQPVFPVTLVVTEPPPFPVGDINCSGAVDLTDLAIVLGYLKLQLPLPMPCQ